VGSRASLDDLERSKMSLSHRDSNHRFSDSQASHYTDFPFRKGRRRMKLICVLVCVCVCVCACMRYFNF
jgi:hypothetical protein